jgi:hypothetical protein
VFSNTIYKYYMLNNTVPIIHWAYLSNCRYTHNRDLTIVMQMIKDIS